MPHTHEVLRNNRKGQSAIEYLTTYGWMLLVIAVVGGAIFSTVQNSSQIESTSGLANAGVQVEQFGVTDQGLQAELRAATTDQVENVNFSLTDQNSGETVYNSEKVTIPVGDTETVTVDDVESGENTKTYSVEITYDTGGLEGLTAEGTITERLELKSSSGSNDSSISSADFQLSGVSDNGSVTEGETLGVDYTVNNDGGSSGTQDITLDVDGVQEDVNNSAYLSSSGSSTGTLTWVTGGGDAGSNIGYTVSTENDSVSGSVDVQTATVSSPSVGGEWSHVKSAGAEGGYDYFFDSSTDPYGKTYGGNSNVEYTGDGFFIMKYQASNDGSDVPVSNGNAGWSGISFNDDSAQSGPSAYSACEALDSQTSDYDIHLTTNREWMTVARQVAQNSTNWADGTVGSTGSSGGLYQGNHDEGGSYDRAVNLGHYPEPASSGGEEQRTHNLASGDSVWDMSGDLYQWVDAEEDGTIMSANSSKIYDKNALNSTVSNGSGLGTDYGFDDGGAALRGGNWINDLEVGVFYAFSDNPSFSSGNLGFRCSAVPVS